MMTKINKPKPNGRLNYAHDNPYIVPSHIQLDSFRNRMKNVLNLYLYMTQPDRSHFTVKRPKFQPFLRRNLHYMKGEVNYSASKRNHRLKPSLSPVFGEISGEIIKSEDAHIPCLFSSPSLSFYRIRFEDRSSEYDYADVQCFRAREIDGQFEGITPVDAAHFHMKLNDELKIDIDLPNFTPTHIDTAHLRSDYLLLKVEIRSDGISVSGGRKLRSVPARQAAQSELKYACDPQRPANLQPQVQVMFGLRKITSQYNGQQGHLIKEGRSQIMLIPASQVGINNETQEWQFDKKLLSRLLDLTKRPITPRQAYMRVEVFVDDDTSYSTAGSVLSSARATPAPQERRNNGDKSIYYIRQRSESETPRDGLSRSSSSASSLNDGFNGCYEKVASTKLGERCGILGVVGQQYQTEMMKAKVPTRLAWCFRMSEEKPNNTEKLSDQTLSNPDYLSSLTDPPPADIFRFTENTCVICSPEYRCPYPTFVSLLYHLCTSHPRLSFRFKKNLVPIADDSKVKSENFSPSENSDFNYPTKRRMGRKAFDNETILDKKPELKQCPGFIVSLNNNYNGAHEFDSNRHYIKRLSLLRQGTGIRRIPEAWNRPPIFLVVKNLARYIRTHPPSQTLDELEATNYMNDGTFGGCAKWQDPHFHTRKYAQRNAPFIQITQRRRTHDYVDVNDNEKQMLNILNDFHSSFRSLMQTHQSYGWNIILVREFRDQLLKPSVYMQYIIHLANLMKIGRLFEAEFLDIISRLHEGPSYDPRADPKHFVYNALRQLESQRPSLIDNQKKNGRKSLLHAQNSREGSISSSTTEDSLPREPIVTRKRSFDGSVASNSSNGLEKKSRLLPVDSDGLTEKKRQFNTKTPTETLLQNAQFHPKDVPIECFDDLACRYQFAPEKYLRLIWHFCRQWTREYLEWQ